jgi:arylsulfatase A-like enzyme
MVRVPEFRFLRMNPRHFTVPALLLFPLLIASGCRERAPEVAARGDDSPPAATDRPPNIVLIMADDLGYAGVGSYGQTQYRTPNIDALAAQGMRFTQFYAGSTVCAPSRSVLLTGLHTGHTPIRGNSNVGGDEGWEIGSESSGDIPLPADIVTFPKLLKQHGYRTGCFGKWGLGRPDSSGNVNEQGFDEFYGYMSHRQAHRYYPEFLYRNGDIEPIEANAGGNEGAYSHDLIVDEAVKFIRSNAQAPFLCYMALTIPHFELKVPEDSLSEYLGKFEEKPFSDRTGTHPDNAAPHATYAAMMTRMDRDVGRLVRLLTELGIERDTLVIFTSDNGDAFRDKTGSDFFTLTGPLRGGKSTLYEGGIRVPFVCRWPGVVPAGAETNTPLYFADIMPTFCEIAGVGIPQNIDGISFVPALRGELPSQPRHDFLYWEFQNRQALLESDRKLVLTWDQLTLSSEVELYDLDADPGETVNIVHAEPDRIAAMIVAMCAARTASDVFPSPFDTDDSAAFGEFEFAGFGIEDPPKLRLLTGFAWQGPHHAWTVVPPGSDDSIFAVKLGEIDGDIQMRLKGLPFLDPAACPAHDVTVLVNGTEVGAWHLDVPRELTYKVTIPEHALKSDGEGEQIITLRIPTATPFAGADRPPAPDQRRALRLTEVRFLREIATSSTVEPRN